MRVLHMTPELPYEPGGGGGRGREYYLCRRLVQRGHDVLNLSPVTPGEAHHAQALRDVGVVNWTVQRPSSQRAEALVALRREPSILATAVTSPVRALEMRVFWSELRPLAQRALREWRPDVVVIGHDMAAGWAQGIPARVPAVLTLHNLTWRWYLSRARRAGRIPALGLQAEAARHRHHLMRVLPRFAHAVCVSTEEAAELRGRSSVPVSVVPIGTDIEALAPAPDPGGAVPPRVVFTGSLGYPPNHQGICWFVERVWPEVLREVPDARLDIVGRDPPASVIALGARPGVTVVGPVALMGPYFDRAHVVVVPILTGAGTRVKIVEAMAAGRAIVSTSLGWEGLPYVEPGRHLLVADQPAAFAQATVHLLRDPQARGSLAAAARQLAVERFDWRALGDEQEAILRDVAAQSARQ